jgi:hypothetical protein
VKTYEETYAAVLQRRNEAETKRKKRNGILKKTLLPAACCLAAVLIAAGLWRGGVFPRPTPVLPPEQTGTPASAENGAENERAAENETAAPGTTAADQTTPAGNTADTPKTPVTAAAETPGTTAATTVPAPETPATTAATTVPAAETPGTADAPAPGTPTTTAAAAETTEPDDGPNGSGYEIVNPDGEWAPYTRYKYAVDEGRYAAYIQGKVITEKNVGGKLEDVTVTAGWMYMNGGEYWRADEHARAEIYEIKGVSTDVAVAIRFTDALEAQRTNCYYVIMNPEADLTPVQDYIINYHSDGIGEVQE